jgi:hypothetical protein
LRPCRRGSQSREGMRSTAGMDRLGGWRAGRPRPAGRYGPQRGAAERRTSPSHRSRYPAAGHAASGHGRSLGQVSLVVTSHGDPGSRSSSTVENRMRDRRHTGAPLPLTAPLMSRADTQHATTTADGATRAATIRSSRPQRPATTRSRQETPVQPRNHGPGLRITQAYRSYGAPVPSRWWQSAGKVAGDGVRDHAS